MSYSECFNSFPMNSIPRIKKLLRLAAAQDPAFSYPHEKACELQAEFLHEGIIGRHQIQHIETLEEPDLMKKSAAELFQDAMRLTRAELGSMRNGYAEMERLRCFYEQVVKQRPEA